MGARSAMTEEVLPSELDGVREAAIRALGDLTPAGAPIASSESRALMLASRTSSGRDLPPYYLVYFLLVDLLNFPDLGQWEKTAWSVPVRYQGRLYVIEHRKMGLGVFAPTFGTNISSSGAATPEAESDAKEIAKLVRDACAAAEPYYNWRARTAVASSNLNVHNQSSLLFGRFEYFCNRYSALQAEADAREKERQVTKTTRADGSAFTTITLPAFSLRKEAQWNALAAIEAFFSWTEHVFLHIAILRCRLRTGEEVAQMAQADWKAKFKCALDLSDTTLKEHYDKLLELRFQIRNFVAHGAFGKRGEAFDFHSGAGAVPVFIRSRDGRSYSISGSSSFDEHAAIDEVKNFIETLWSGQLEAANIYLSSGLPSILTYTTNGFYSGAMASAAEMESFVEHLSREVDNAANMDW
jgi:hypothetical protein